ncbi:MAG: hypothetical protein JNM58_00215 [Xanthomonadaceae bacterium]|nr:hypothetical protein [Xanthomonadaceae bacterium]
MILFFALVCLSLAIAGFCALVIFWPLTLVHLRDRHPELHARLGDFAFAKPSALWWLLRGGYREAPDPGLSGLATPARVSLSVILLGLFAAGILWLWAEAFA